MNNVPKILISVDSDDADPVRNKQCVDLLRRNLSFAGIRVSKHLEDAPRALVELESRSDPISLYTLGLTFITSGAAVALINAVRATFVAAHNSKLRVKIVLQGKAIELSGDSLTDSRAQQLLETLQKELQS
jgi:hypothetical protein